MPWNPDQYHKFQSERSAPFFDLLKLVEVRPHLRVVDLGCGTGELTRVLADALPESDVTGMDSSTEMLEKASPYARPKLRFEPGDLSNLAGQWDLIYSNAAIQWCDGHEKLLPYLYATLNPGGQLCGQVPSNHNHISQKLIRETAREQPFRTILRDFERQSPVLSIEEYAQILFDCDAVDIVVFEKVYPHVMENADAIVEWISGTALVPYFEGLGGHRAAFVEVLGQKMRRALPGSPLLYPFRRTFFSARKPHDTAKVK